MSKSRVFIVCEPTQRVGSERVRSVDLTPAAEWGEPVILLRAAQACLDMTPTIELLKKKLESFSDDDYLVPIGDPVLMCTVAAIAASVNEGRVVLLKWDRQITRYIPIRVNIGEYSHVDIA